MLIGIDASRANKIQKTGVEWYSYFLIQELKKISDPDVQFILYSTEPLRDGLENLPSNFQNKVLKWPPKRLWTQIRLSLEMLINPPDVLFVPAHGLPLIHPPKSAVTCHDIAFERFPELYSPKDLKYQKWLMNFHLKNAAKIITVSEFTKNEIIDVYKCGQDKIEVVSNGLDAENYHLIEDKNRVEDTLKKYKIQKPYILYIGRLEKKKNTLGLIEAFRDLKNINSELSNCKLVLVGHQGYGFGEVDRAIKENKLQDKIIMPGWVEEKDLPLLLNGAELFVFPSFYEGFGIPVLEAMACGTPVLASNSSSTPEVAGDAAYLIDPYKSEEIAEGMAKILLDEGLKSGLRAKGLERVKNFSWARCAEETLKVLKSLND